MSRIAKFALVILASIVFSTAVQGSAYSDAKANVLDRILTDETSYGKVDETQKEENEKRILGLKTRDLIICGLFFGAYIFIRSSIYSRKSDL